MPSFEETQPTGPDNNQNQMKDVHDGDMGYATLEAAQTSTTEVDGKNNDFRYKTLHADPSSIQFTMDSTNSSF